MARHTLTYTRTDTGAVAGGVSGAEVAIVTEGMQAVDVWHCLLALWSTQEAAGRRQVIKQLDAIAAAIDDGINPRYAHLGPIAHETCIQQHGKDSPLCPK